MRIHTLKMFAFAAFFSTILFPACAPDDLIEVFDYDIPAIYNFEHVSYSGQTQRLAMLTEMTSYMKSGVSVDVSLDLDRLTAMYTNDSNLAGWQGSYESSKQLKNKTFEPVQADFETLLGQMVEASASTDNYTAGTAGISISSDGTKTYLFNERGVEPVQLIEKGLMGACFYYQAATVYLGWEKMNVDNTIINPGVGTEMEHHWDEAFGYLGAPIDFPTNTDGLFFWAKYANATNAVTNNNQSIMGPLLTGRAAISNNDLQTRDDAIVKVREVWEQIVAAAAIHYLNIAVQSFEDEAIRLHALSEALAFVYSLKFNEEKSQTNETIDTYLSQLATTSNITAFDLTNSSTASVLVVRDQLAADFGLSDVKEAL
jgi:hypothetical protein